MHKLAHGSTLAFDFGKARIGVACGDAEVGTAHPLCTIQSSSKQQRFAEIARLIEQWQAVQLLVGLPVHADGTAHELTHAACAFGQSLARRFTLPVYWADERFSSLYAETLLNEAGLRGRKQKAVLDQVAAQAILFTAFDNGCWQENELQAEWFKTPANNTTNENQQSNTNHPLSHIRES